MVFMIFRLVIHRGYELAESILTTPLKFRKYCISLTSVQCQTGQYPVVHLYQLYTESQALNHGSGHLPDECRNRCVWYDIVQQKLYQCGFSGRMDDHERTTLPAQGRGDWDGSLSSNEYCYANTTCFHEWTLVISPQLRVLSIHCR